MNARLDKLRGILVYMVIIFLPVMSVINVFGRIKINMALSDAFAALIMLLTIIDYKSFSLKRNFPYWWYFAGLMGLMVISNTLAHFNTSIATGNILSIANEFIKFAITGVYFFVGYNCLNDRERMISALRVWMYTALVVSIIGIAILLNTNIGTAIHPDIPARVLKQRLVGTLTDPNLTATYLGVSFYVSLFYICSITKKRDKYIGILSLAIIAAAIALTQSRSGMVAFIISLLLYSIINIRKLYKYITIIILLLFISYFGYLNLDAVYFDKQFSTLMDQRMEEMLKGEGEAVSRLNLTTAAFMMGKDNFLFGVGRGNYTLNSEQYYKELGIDLTSEYYKNWFSKFIPHNTYMTFFAELGILGLVLFLSIFYKVVRINIRKGAFHIIILCLFGFYMFQAIAVNLENFRGIWFIIGITLANYRMFGIMDSDREQETLKLSAKKIYIFNAGLFIFSVYVFLNTVPYYTDIIQLVKQRQSQDITNLKPDEEYVFRYFVRTETDDVSKPSSKISIYGVDKYSKETLLNEITHYSPNGYGSLVFVPHKDIKKVRIRAELLDSSNATVCISDASVINKQTGEGQKVYQDYIYVPDSIENLMMNLGLIKTNTKLEIAALDQLIGKSVDNDGIVFFDGKNPVNLSNKILFLGSKIDQLSEGQAKISLYFKCIDKIEVDYGIWLHGMVIDQGLLPQEQQKYGFANWDHALTTNTTNWKVGSLYEHKYTINVKPGQYYISFGFWNPKWKDGKSYRLTPGIELANYQIK